MNKQQKNGTNQLDAQMEQMRMQVVQLELRARYWKAQYDIKQYMLADRDLKEDYEAYMTELVAEETKKLEDLKQHIAENEDKGLAIEPVTQEEPVNESEQQA
jgi:hypothetical protein